MKKKHAHCMEENSAPPTMVAAMSSFACDYRCALCDKSFTCSYSLHRHILSHAATSDNGTELTCKKPDCGMKFTSDTALRSHVENMHMEKKFPCRICAKMFTRIGNLTRHMKIHENVREFLCRLCGKDFTQRAHLDKHMMIHFRECPECPKCHKVFIKLKHFSSHVNNIRKQSSNCKNKRPPPPNDENAANVDDQYSGSPSFVNYMKCPICFLSHRDEKKLKMHVHEVHHVTNTCPLCGVRHIKFEKMVKHLKECYSDRAAATATASILDSLVTLPYVNV